MEPIFLKPVFKQMIWGGSRLREFGYEIPGDDTGENISEKNKSFFVKEWLHLSFCVII